MSQDSETPKLGATPLIVVEEEEKTDPNLSIAELKTEQLDKDRTEMMTSPHASGETLVTNSNATLPLPLPARTKTAIQNMSSYSKATAKAANPNLHRPAPTPTPTPIAAPVAAATPAPTPTPAVAQALSQAQIPTQILQPTPTPAAAATPAPRPEIEISKGTRSTPRPAPTPTPAMAAQPSVPMSSDLAPTQILTTPTPEPSSGSSLGASLGLSIAPTPAPSMAAQPSPVPPPAPTILQAPAQPQAQAPMQQTPSPIQMVPQVPVQPPSPRPHLMATPSTQPTATPTAAPRNPVRMPEMGPLEVFMQDPKITEIMVNDLRNVMIEKDGKVTFSGFSYQSIDELNRLTRNILDISGKIMTHDQPYVDLMLPDGSRVNIVGPPLTTQGPCITIRKFPSQKLSIQDLMNVDTLDQRIAYFLNACVVGRLNILVSGGTGSGKTTFLNVLSTFIPKGERVITIEDTPELSISHFNSVKLQTKPSTPMSAGVSARDLVANALRMRPDRIIVGECRKMEAFDMLQAMNTGHGGSMTTIHANSPRDALSRLETLCMLAGSDLPVGAVRKQMAGAVDLIIQLKRFRNGKRRVVAVSEVAGMEGDTILLQDIFIFEINISPGVQPESGNFKVTGFVPKCVERLREQGIELPRNYFGV